MENLNPKSTVGRIVHYTRYDEDLCLAALVTSSNEDGTVDLMAFQPDGDGTFPVDDCPEGTEHGTWHWPERA